MQWGTQALGLRCAFGRELSRVGVRRGGMTGDGRTVGHGLGGVGGCDAGMPMMCGGAKLGTVDPPRGWGEWDRYPLVGILQAGKKTGRDGRRGWIGRDDEEATNRRLGWLVWHYNANSSSSSSSSSNRRSRT